MSDEHIDIRGCPKCGAEHRYSLKVERAYVMRLITGGPEPISRVSFTRLFTCPIKNEEFQAEFTLTDSSSGKITSVEVLGIGGQDERH